MAVQWLVNRSYPDIDVMKPPKENPVALPGADRIMKSSKNFDAITIIHFAEKPAVTAISRKCRLTIPTAQSICSLTGIGECST